MVVTFSLHQSFCPNQQILMLRTIIRSHNPISHMLFAGCIFLLIIRFYLSKINHMSLSSSDYIAKYYYFILLWWEIRIQSDQLWSGDKTLQWFSISKVKVLPVAYQFIERDNWKECHNHPAENHPPHSEHAASPVLAAGWVEKTLFFVQAVTLAHH